MIHTTLPIFLLTAFTLTGCHSMEATEIALKSAAHHTATGFRNPHSNVNHGFGAFLRWQFARGPHEQAVLADIEIPDYVPRFAESDLQRIRQPAADSIQITWIGHASFLIQVAGLNILTDPIFSQRCSPVSFAGPKRLARPGLAFADLPEIDAVVISHDHYDHLDDATIRRLGKDVKYFVPLGLGDWLRERGREPLFEADWWQSQQLGDVRLHAVPAQHFSGRSFLSRNGTLWCGWVIETPQGNIYFAGDTGYSPQFKEIGERFGAMKVAMIPIGAYKPRWFMGAVHVDPRQAVQIHQDVRAWNSIAMHWGTFKLADEQMAEPPVFLASVLRESNIDPETFSVMRFGETRLF